MQWYTANSRQCPCQAVLRIIKDGRFVVDHQAWPASRGIVPAVYSMPAACKPPSLLLSWLRRCCEHMLYCECLLLTVVVPSDAGHAAQWWQVMTGATASSRLHALIIHPIMTHSQARGLHFHHNRTTPKTNPPLSGLNPLMPWLPWPRHPPEPSRSQLLYTRSAPCPGTPWPPACSTMPSQSGSVGL